MRAMRMTVVVAVLVVALVVARCSREAAAQCTAAEEAELLLFKAGVTSDPGGSLATWVAGKDCCEWEGVTCEGGEGEAVVVAVDRSGKSLGGGIAAGFGSSGALARIRSLVLSGNQLGGDIADSLADLTTLQALWLDRNSLGGIIPGVLVKLQSLTAFNVSTNGLAGQIPQALPFTAFPTSSYANNPGLCGTPLPACQSI